MTRILILGPGAPLARLLAARLARDAGARVDMDASSAPSSGADASAVYDAVVDLRDPDTDALVAAARALAGRTARYVVARRLGEALVSGNAPDAAGARAVEGGSVPLREEDVVLGGEREAADLVPLTSVRFGFLAGPDDGGVLAWHADRARRHGFVRFPNLFARVSITHTDDACAALAWACGPRPGAGGGAPGFEAYNAAPEDGLLLGAFCDELAAACGSYLDLAGRLEGEGAENLSPLGARDSLELDGARLRAAGVVIRPTADWLAGALADAFAARG